MQLWHNLSAAKKDQQQPCTKLAQLARLQCSNIWIGSGVRYNWSLYYSLRTTLITPECPRNRHSHRPMQQPLKQPSSWKLYQSPTLHDRTCLQQCNYEGNLFRAQGWWLRRSTLFWSESSLSSLQCLRERGRASELVRNDLAPRRTKPVIDLFLHDNSRFTRLTQFHQCTTACAWRKCKEESRRKGIDRQTVCCQ